MIRLLILAALLAVLVAAPAWADGVIIKGNTTFDANYPEAYSGQSGSPAGFTVGGAASDPNAGLELKAKGSGVVSIPGPATIGGTLGVAGAVNTTSPLGYQITGTSVLNLLSNQASPILSPETQNAPSPGATYIPAPSVRGYNSTAGASTYESMVTSNLTVTGTVSNHYGMLESTLNLTGTGTMNAEINQEKSYVVIPSGVPVLFGENKELALSNSGTITHSWAAASVYPRNEIGGILVHGYGIKLDPYNLNTTANTFQTWTGFACDPLSGGGSAITFNQCIYNADASAVITNAGHYAARPDGGNVPVLSNCGTSPSLNSRANDDAGQITTGTGATACTLTFHLQYSNIASAVVIASNGAAPPIYTYSASAITISAATAGAVYQYWVLDGY